MGQHKLSKADKDLESAAVRFEQACGPGHPAIAIVHLQQAELQNLRCVACLLMQLQQYSHLSQAWCDQ